MFRSIQWRIAVPFILLIIISMSGLGFYLTNFARDSQLDNLRSLLEKEARITSEASLPGFLAQSGNLDTLAKKLGGEIDARVTIIAPDGISGNLIFRTLLHLGGGHSHGAFYLGSNFPGPVMDTSRVGSAEEYTGAVVLALRKLTSRA